jgi:hypothetical protein
MTEEKDRYAGVRWKTAWNVVPHSLGGRAFVRRRHPDARHDLPPASLRRNRSLSEGKESERTIRRYSMNELRHQLRASEDGVVASATSDVHNCAD